MPTMEATRVVHYAGKDQQVGDLFEAPAKDAKILVAIQKAKYSEGPAKSPSDLPEEVMSRASKREPATEEDEVEEVAEVEKDVDPKPAQTYLHRAMVAEAPKAPPPAPPPSPKARPVEPMRFMPSPSPAKGKPGRPFGKGRK